MADISAALVKELRERTGAGFMDCKKVLLSCDGNIDKAIDELKKKALAAGEKKSGRVAAEGLVHSYIHGGGRVGVLVEVNCETDFVAKNETFVEFVKDVSMHVAAMNPVCVHADEVPEADRERQKAIFIAQAEESGKPPEIAEKMVGGRIKKWLKEICLLDQAWVKDPSKSIGEYQNEVIAVCGEKVTVRRFLRYELGSGIEKKDSNLAAEVAELTQ
jgi:elongation factor Ts